MDTRLEIRLGCPPIPGIGTVGHLELRRLPVLATIERHQHRLQPCRAIVVGDAAYGDCTGFQFGPRLRSEDVTHQANVPSRSAVLQCESELFSWLEESKRNTILGRMVEVWGLGCLEPQPAEPLYMHGAE